MKMCATLILLAILITGVLNAEVSVLDYKTLKASGELPKDFESYLVGVGRGAFWASAIAEPSGGKKLFCMPEKLALDKGVILAVLDQELRESDPAIIGKRPIELVLVNAFRTRFPCDKQQPSTETSPKSK